jgi:hypothetical protein
MSDNILSKATNFVEEHPWESAGIGLVALASGGIVGRKVLSNIAMKEFAPWVATEVAEGMTARAVGDGVLFSAADGTTIMARKGLVQVATPEVAGTLSMTDRATQIALKDGTTIRNGGFLSKGEDIWTKVGGENGGIKTHSYSSSFNTPKFDEISIGDKLKIKPTSVEFPGGQMNVRSISGPGDPVDVMSGRFGTGTFENVADRTFTKDGVSFSTKGFNVDGFSARHGGKSYATLIKDLSH